jgi:pimeloyl-ACP methyl ester carboxylesterase
MVATFALIHGGGGSAWDWHLVVAELQKGGHHAVAVDLPSEQESADWQTYARAVVDAVADRPNLIVVGHSLGGFTAPLVCAYIPVDLLILVAAMIPSPGERFDDWWENAG